MKNESAYKAGYLFIVMLLITLGVVYIEQHEEKLPERITEKQAEAVKETCLKLGLRMKITNTEKENKAACYK